MQKIIDKAGKPTTLTLGTILAIISSLSLLILSPNYKKFIYIVVPFIGIAQAITLNSSIAFISDVVGLKGQSGAFVFGFYSFLDKFGTGIIIFTITNSSYMLDSNFIKWMTSIIPLGSVVLGWLLAIIKRKRIKNKKFSLL